ncbi:sulfotransferase ssu-1-like [Dermacentor silvarum]|uniref:sulfotransferase ssu-1-like n=1 Tax=Dermacentor silvarum TaxID=543639 RepID=UPI002100D679|nr:sulfotransferase ssu-1-like [Dermacentor silvarum]
MSRRKPYAQIIDGIPRSPNYDPDLLRAALEFKAQKGDLVLSTYPKSGTHWMLYITQLILKGGEPVSGYSEFIRNIRVLGVVGFDAWTPSLPLRLFSTHLPLGSTTMNKDAKYVYVARNPWDLCVSSYHMIKKLGIYRFRDGTFEELFDAFLEGDCAGQGSYFDHVASGYALRDQPNLFFVTYEELKRDTRSVILRLARFLGDDYGDKLEKDEELLQEIVDRCGSDNMKRDLEPESKEHTDPDWYKATARIIAANSRIFLEDAKQFSIVRKGDVGDWQGYFTRDQLWRLEARIKQLEEHSCVMDLWKDTRAAALKFIANE